MKNFPFSTTFAVVLAALILPLSAFAGILTLNGDTTNSLIFNRPTETGASSFQNPRYNAYFFTVDISGPYTLSLTAADPASYDTFLHLYQGGFNAADPEANFLRANDDGPGGTDAGSVLAGVSLTAGTSYYLVADGFSAVDYGVYAATINGPGTASASLVPEPSSIVLAGIAAGIGSLICARRKRRQV